MEAFAWWSDLMVDHAETFLCLYSADMDAALEVQPPDSWDSFPLFQLLNDFLRTDCESPATRSHTVHAFTGSLTRPPTRSYEYLVAGLMHETTRQR